MKFTPYLSILGAGVLVMSPAISYGAEPNSPAHPSSPVINGNVHPSQILSRQETVAKAGQLQWRNGSFPVENFQGYTSPFGYRTSPTGRRTREFHSGLDFAAPTGSYVRSWWAGKVVQVSGHTACGTSVRIQSGSWVHVYCHLQGRVRRERNGAVIIDRGSGLQIRKGQPIKAGQRIGRVGMTGRTTGPHLHWTLKYQGKLVDPGAVLRAMYTAQRGGSITFHPTP